MIVADAGGVMFASWGRKIATESPSLTKRSGRMCRAFSGVASRMETLRISLREAATTARRSTPWFMIVLLLPVT